MNRVLLVFFAVFALVARSDGELKCYMCNSLTEPSCEDPTKNATSPPVVCNLAEITKWNTKTRQIQAFQHIPKIFDVDHPQQTPKPTDAACAKMILKLGNKNVTLRSCQSAKSPSLDVCHSIREQLEASATYTQGATMSFCDLCGTDGCNGAMDVAPKTVQLLLGPVFLLVVQACRQSFA